MKTLILTTALVLAASSTYLNQVLFPTTPKLNTIVLVHGAWVDSSSWSKVTPILEEEGHEVIVVNLPGHGTDTTNLGTVKLQDYVDAVIKAIGNRTDVTLVGHSMSGTTISEVAEQIPDQIKNLIYVGAILPQDGESLVTISQHDTVGILNNFLIIDETNGKVSVKPQGIKEIFASDLPVDEVNDFVVNTKPDPLLPFVTPVHLTDGNFGRVKKSYVFTLFDKAIGLPLQKEMVEKAGITRAYQIPSSHTPFFAMPNVLALIILQEAE